ncbi:UDP-N-acetylmuramate dehydrogenase [Moheibacter sediminis]|uniref:UDP-N-acetylenolpyruvoylglucosamine reductase n=1 Tax=Moheibacter sediminis TaxID=1434700 RepID=A0A1W2AEE4_9FLAO|nr:UDP-N-acetylmuramate dehydrogenase [Moheibacter sediminis]SMC58862.1 UDP-N-acetylmuramate dehydrogenase [Moheibacter sediminis]
MEVIQNKSLKPYNTFGLDVSAKYFVEADSKEKIISALNFAKENNQPVMLLNGGSNMLLTHDFEGLVLKLNLKGIEIISENEDFVKVKVNSAENWHEFVQWTLQNDFGGLENLSLIPGNCGTAPIQNIGAYGVEIKDVMSELSALHIATREIKIFANEECKFGYRESVFKNEFKGQFILLDVTFKLTKKNHILHTSYGAIQSELNDLNISNPTIQDVSKAVVNIRQSKLPDPKEIGNSGSFFKNPVISKSKFEELQKQFPDISGYVTGDEVKVAAGWLIENAGWKGKRFGDAGVHEKQALVLVNYGNATGQEIYDLSQQILDDIWTKFGIQLEREVNIL